MPKAVIINDHAQLNQALVKKLQRFIPNWTVVGITTPETGLTYITAEKPELVLCDGDLPKHSNFLEKVMEISPESIRILMTNQISNEKAARSPAHQQLVKPFGIPELKTAVEQTTEALNWLKTKEFHTFVLKLKNIPTLPTTYQQIQSQLKDECNDNEGIHTAIKKDPGLSIKILQLVNAPSMGRAMPVTDISDGILILGRKTIEILLMAQAIFKSYANLPETGINVKQIWNQSWEVAQKAKDIAKELGLSNIDAEHAFLAGMLQEIGTLILLDNAPERVRQACKNAIQQKHSLDRAFQEEFKTNTKELTTYIFNLWGLPQEAGLAIQQRDNTGERIGKVATIADALYLANLESWEKQPYLACPGPFKNEKRLEELLVQ